MIELNLPTTVLGSAVLSSIDIDIVMNNPLTETQRNTLFEGFSLIVPESPNHMRFVFGGISFQSAIDLAFDMQRRVEALLEEDSSFSITGTIAIILDSSNG